MKRLRRDDRVALSPGKWFSRPRDPLSLGYRAVTNRTARSPLSLYTPAKVSERDENSNAYRAVARRRSAYAAMTVWRYRRVSGFHDPAIRFLWVIAR